MTSLLRRAASWRRTLPAWPTQTAMAGSSGWTVLAFLLTACSSPGATSPIPRTPWVRVEAATNTPSSLSSPPASGAFYVSPNGDDAGPGTTTQPWRTLQHAADRLDAGQTVYVRAGTYQESVTLTRSGAPTRPITFAAVPGQTVFLDGSKRSLDSGFQSDPNQPVSDIVITGFTIQNFSSFGVVFWSVNDRIALTDLIILDNGASGIRFSNSDGSRVQRVSLRGNEGGFDCTPILPGAQSDPGCTHLYLADVQALDNGRQGDTGTDQFAVERGADILVERCVASGGVGDGFDFKSDRTTLRQVVAHDTRNNIKLWGKASVLASALAYDARADANLVLAAGGSYTVINATIANMAGTAYLAVAGDTSGSGPTPVLIVNTIFYNDNPANEGTLLYFGPEVVGLVFSNNLFFNPFRTDALLCADFAPFGGQCWSDSDINAGAWGASNRSADPRFADAPGKDFTLRLDSPAVNQGTGMEGVLNELLGCVPSVPPNIGWLGSGECSQIGPQ